MLAVKLSHSSSRLFLADLAPSRRFGGCCGFVGPFPPPLLMRYSIFVLHGSGFRGLCQDKPSYNEHIRNSFLMSIRKALILTIETRIENL